MRRYDAILPLFPGRRPIPPLEYIMTAPEAFELFTGSALRALNAQNGSPSPFGAHIITSPALRIGDLLNTLAGIVNRSPVVSVLAADATGGDTDTSLVVAARDLNGNALKSALQFIVVAQADRYDPEVSADASVTFSAATTGTLVDSGAGWALVQTDNNGDFACTISNSADETLYLSAMPPVGGASDVSLAALQVASNSDDVTWSA